MERGGVMEYIGEKFGDLLLAGSGTYRMQLLILYVVFEMQKKKMSRLSSANTHSSLCFFFKTPYRKSELFQQH